MPHLTLSSLPKTWIFDVDGTLVLHNGHLRPEGDEILPGVLDFFEKIPEQDMVILITARESSCKEGLERFLSDSGIRFDAIIYGAPVGERVLVNDKKPSGLLTAYSINKDRNGDFDLRLEIDGSL